MEQSIPIKESDAIQMLHQYNEEMLPKKFGRIGKAWTGLLIIVFLTGVYFYTVQLRKGLIITGMRDFVFWGIYISNFVFFVAISLVGSLITAVLYLLKISWRAPLTRLAEIIAVAAIIFAGLIIVVDMGRPERVVNMFRYGRIQSPIIWDVMVVTTYMTLSILLLYFPLLPSIAFCRDHMKGIPKWQHKMYKVLSLGWKNNPEQYKLVKKAVTILSVMIIPVALCIHTVTSWLFASTYRPGWDSTNFGAYFVSGAFLVGCGGVVAGMYLLRRFNWGYDKYLTDNHFDKMGKLLVLLAMIYAYFSINEYLIPAYKMKGEEAHHLKELFTGYYAPMFWSVQFFGMILPIIVLLFKKGRKPLPMFIMAVLVIVCAWFKRYLIVIPTMSFLPVQEIPEAWKHYSPTFQEWAITGGSLAGALLIITFFVRYFPIISVWEVAEEKGISHDIITKHLHEGNENDHLNTTKSWVSRLIIIPLISALLFGHSVLSQEVKDSSKLSFSMSVSSILSDNSRSVKAHLIKKVNNKKTIVDDLKTPLNLYLNEVKDHDATNGTGWISKAYVNDEGDAIFQFPNWFNNLTDTFHQFTFIVKMDSDPKYENAEEQVTVSKARIDLEYAGEDSIKTASATLFGWVDNAYVPIPKVGMRLCIKRTFNFLPFGEVGATTNDSGKISGDLPLDLPGNSNKTITIAARLEDDETYGTVEVTKDVPWSILPKVNPVRGRTLWSGADNAPLLLVISSLAIIGIIWGTIFYLISLLIKIKRLGKT